MSYYLFNFLVLYMVYYLQQCLLIQEDNFEVKLLYKLVIKDRVLEDSLKERKHRDASPT